MTDSSDGAPLPVRPPWSTGARVAVPLLSVLAVLLLASGIALGLTVKNHVDDRHALERARDAAVVAARQEILNLDTIAVGTVDSDLTRILDGATGTFRDQFSRAQATLKATIVQKKSSSTGTIVSAGVVRADTSTATILVAANRTVRDASDPTGGVAHDRWQVDLEKHGGRWLVANLQPVA